MSDEPEPTPTPAPEAPPQEPPAPVEPEPAPPAPEEVPVSDPTPEPAPQTVTAEEFAPVVLVETHVQNPGELRRIYDHVQRPDGSTLELGPGESDVALLPEGFEGSLYLQLAPPTE
jgi:hypothetical protein